MKFFLTFVINFAITTYTFAQSDTIKPIDRGYKNNLQTDLFTFGGYNSLQFERAVRNKISINIIAGFNYPYYSKKHPIDYYVELMPQVRWYTQKKKTKYNQGFYLSASCDFVFYKYYTDGAYNPTTGDIALDNHINVNGHYNANFHNINGYNNANGYYYEDNIIRQKRAVYSGAGLGYKWLIKKRIVVDLGMSIQYAIFQQERFRNVPVQNNWEKAYYYRDDARFHFNFPAQINIGYAF